MMKKLLSFLICLCLIIPVLPVYAQAYFQVTCYEEEIYAGGVVDLYAFVEGDYNVDQCTFQWQYDVSIGDGHWYDLEDNDSYKGTKTNHMQLHTKTGSYPSWEEIPFQCVVTAPDGTKQYTPVIFMHIRPTEDLFPAMEKWGYGLYEPTLSNVTNLKTNDYKSYTGYTYAGNNLTITCGSKPVEQKQILSNSEVTLNTEIHITENGHTTVASNRTSYIPYTVGSVKVEIKQRCKIASHDLGYFDTKTINLTTSKPATSGTGKAKSDCSLLRYTYNESQKLASIPKGTSVEVVKKEGSYYQVLYNNMVGYVGASLLETQNAVDNPVIKEVDILVTKPVAGKSPDFNCQVVSEGSQLYKTDPVMWMDKTTGKEVKSTDKFQEGHDYGISVWVEAKSGYRFQTDASYNPKLAGSINGNLPPFIYKAYEQDPEKVVELQYTFYNVQKEPEHVCGPILVSRVAPTCTTTGHEKYYKCACGKTYSDPGGTKPINPSSWGIIAATGHTGGTATCQKRAVCTVCGVQYGEKADHAWSSTYDYTQKSGHAHSCTTAGCMSHDTLKNHVPGKAATETTAQTCIECGYIIEPAKNHVHELTKVEEKKPTCTQPGIKSHYTCSGCSDLFADAEGKTGITDVTVAPTGHKLQQQWHYDAQNHWYTCMICLEPAQESLGVHSFEGAVCTVCGYEDGKIPAPEPVPEELPKPAPEQVTEPSETAAEQEKEQSEKPKYWLLPVVAVGCFAAALAVSMLLIKRKKT